MIFVPTSTDKPSKFIVVFAAVPIFTFVAPPAAVPMLIVEFVPVLAPVPIFRVLDV